GDDAPRGFALPWFERMRACGADVRELMHDGCPTACVDDAAFAYVGAFTAHVNVGFFQGASLKDPSGLSRLGKTDAACEAALGRTGERDRAPCLDPGRL